MEAFKLLPIDWQAIAAVMTFFAVAAAFYSSYQYRRREKVLEKREIIERIIRPLEESVNSLLSVWSGLSSHYFPNWKLKWHDIQKENPYLIFKLPQNAKYLLDSFDEDLNKFANLSNQKLPKLKKEITTTIREQLVLLVGEEEGMVARYQGKIGGKYFSISFLNLLLAKKNLDAYLEELGRDSALPNIQIEEDKFVVPGFPESSKEKFEKVFAKIQLSIQNNTELKSYIESWIAIIEKTKNLSTEIKEYEN